MNAARPTPVLRALSAFVLGLVLVLPRVATADVPASPARVALHEAGGEALPAHPLARTSGDLASIPRAIPKPAPPPQPISPLRKALLAIVVPPLPTGPRPESNVPTALRLVADVGYQTMGIVGGLVEKALGRHAPNLAGPYKPIEVKDPSGTRSLVVYRSNQAKTVDDVATFVDLARGHGATNLSQILFVNLRTEHDEDSDVLAQYHASVGVPSEAGIRKLTVPILDNSPPAFYVGSLGWNRAVDKVHEIYTALKNPAIKVGVVHCEQGRARTGEVIATAVRVAMDGMSVKDAIAEAEQHGLNMPWQRAFIERFAREWQEGKIRFDEPKALPAPSPVLSTLSTQVSS